MTIILFLIDSSASMNQKTYLGPSLLDVAKGAVDTILKLRMRERGGDRYMLLSFEDSPKQIKCGWKENPATFVQELKNMRASGLTNLGPALANAFHLLNVNRLQTGIDTYGQGRSPFFVEPVVIIAITDGQSLTSLSGVHSAIEFRMPALAGSELTIEPFRWDQRLFSLVLRIPGHAPEQPPPGSLISSDYGPITAMCEVTGGRSYCITNHKMLNQCLDSICQKMQHGVVVRLEKFGPDPAPVVPSNETLETKNNNVIENGYYPNDFLSRRENKLLNHVNQEPSQSSGSRSASPMVLLPTPEWHVVRRMIYVQRPSAKTGPVGHWPIPEAYWPDPQSTNLAQRSAHPVIRFKCEDCEPVVIENFPFDKYELEPSPLTQYILERRQNTTCWQVFVPHSGKYSGDASAPFGYLKAATKFQCVNLFVMPYNYPKLFPLLQQLTQTFKNKPNKEWKAAFEKYLKTIPSYYYSPLKRALQRIGAEHVMPSTLDSSMSHSVVAYLKRVRHEAKLEFDRLCESVGQSSVQERIKLVPRSQIPLTSLLREAVNVNSEYLAVAKAELNDYATFTLHPNPSVAMLESKGAGAPYFVAPTSAMFRNPFDIPRSKLLQQLEKMRANFRQHLCDTLPVLEGGLPGIPLKVQFAEELHSLPVAQMGVYLDYTKRLPQPLRELVETPVRQHAFGNPFKVDRQMCVDEAEGDIDFPDAAQANTSRGAKRAASSEQAAKRPSSRKRKPGPLPKDYRYKRRRMSESGVYELLQESGSCEQRFGGSEPASPALSTTESEESEVDGPLSDVADDDQLFSDDGDSENTLAIADEVPFTVYGTHEERDEPSTSNLGSTASDTSPVVDAVGISTVGATVEGNNIARLVRRPGRDYAQLLVRLDSLSGQTKRDLTNYAIAEAGRFKRNDLRRLLTECLRKEVPLTSR